MPDPDPDLCSSLSPSQLGTFDRMLKRNESCSREAAAALAHAMRAKSFWRPDAVQHRKQQEPPLPGYGYFWRLPWQERDALISIHTSRFVNRKVDAADNAETNMAYHKAKVKTSSEKQLQALITEFGYGLSIFERWQQRGVRNVSKLTEEAGCSS